MKSIFRSALILLMFATCSLAFAQQEPLDESIYARADASWEQALKIWGWAEVGYHEDRSAALLMTSLQAAGVSRVERGASTRNSHGFHRHRWLGQTGDRGSGGEYDALPGLAQENVAERKSRPGASAGHACGHHLFGVASASASIAARRKVAGPVHYGERFAITDARRKRAAAPRLSLSAQDSSTTATPCCTGIPRPGTRRVTKSEPGPDCC